jgi:hypothetical protein
MTGLSGAFYPGRKRPTPGCRDVMPSLPLTHRIWSISVEDLTIAAFALENGRVRSTSIRDDVGTDVERFFSALKSLTP